MAKRVAGFHSNPETNPVTITTADEIRRTLWYRIWVRCMYVVIGLHLCLFIIGLIGFIDGRMTFPGMFWLLFTAVFTTAVELLPDFSEWDDRRVAKKGENS